LQRQAAAQAELQLPLMERWAALQVSFGAASAGCMDALEASLQQLPFDCALIAPVEEVVSAMQVK
jgi:hypothetical protein